MKNIILLLLFIPTTVFAQYNWEKQESASDYRGKQDDIYFVNSSIGWYVNGSGQIFKTLNGGEMWEMIYEQKGTFFRCIGFVDSLLGFAGNVGTDYFPGVEDTVPLYKTIDGGKTWSPVDYSGPTVKGLCAIDIVKVPYTNHGKLDYKYHIYAAGRVGSPSFLLTSTDGGETFTSKSMEEHCGYILDIKFFNEKKGIICAGTNASFEEINALILLTNDGGKTWNKVYQSTRPYEITWKMHFPDNNNGYVTIQSYNPDTTIDKRYVAKTIDGGNTWEELLLTDDYKCREFGVGFITPEIGWVGAIYTGYETTDGGKTWKEKDIGKVVNKLRIMDLDDKYIGYAIGSSVYKLEVEK